MPAEEFAFHLHQHAAAAAEALGSMWMRKRSGQGPRARACRVRSSEAKAHQAEPGADDDQELLWIRTERQAKAVSRLGEAHLF